MRNLEYIKCFLLDMDGTFYLGNRLIDGAADFLNILKEQHKRFIFMTNNSSKNKSEYRSKLKTLGCDVDENDIFTSGEATIIYLNGIKRGASIFLMGTPFLRQEFCDAGFRLIRGRGGRPDFVVLGFDTTLTYDKIWAACDYIRDGVPFVATHPDFNCPIEDGRYMPDAGSMIEMFKASTGKSPRIIGKPNRYIVDAVTEKYGIKREDIAIVGDRLYTDIKTGADSGITSILVFSGETSREDYESSDIRADYQFDSIKEIGDAIKESGI